MKILILNGPNLNLLGKRELDIYGSETIDDLITSLQRLYPDVNIEYYQSNVEGALIDKLHEVGFTYNGIVFNPGGYTHTSVSIRDAIAGISTPVIEVHISNIYARESFRQVSLTAASCKGVISGLGISGYHLADKYLVSSKFV